MGRKEACLLCLLASLLSSNLVLGWFLINWLHWLQNMNYGPACPFSSCMNEVSEFSLLYSVSLISVICGFLGAKNHNYLNAWSSYCGDKSQVTTSWAEPSIGKPKASVWACWTHVACFHQTYAWMTDQVALTRDLLLGREACNTCSPRKSWWVMSCSANTVRIKSQGTHRNTKGKAKEVEEQFRLKI